MIPRLLGGRLGSFESVNASVGQRAGSNSTASGDGIPIFGIVIPTDPLQLLLWGALIAAAIFLFCQALVYLVKFINWLLELLEPPVGLLSSLIYFYSAETY